MLERQKIFVTYLEQLAALLGPSGIESDPQLQAQISQIELLVPVVGAFSAGKSSLLNTLLGQNILPVGLAPETELATELRYAPESYLLAIHADEREERLPVEALHGINQRAKEFSHLQLYLDNPALKRIAPLVLVDMPGYGSSLESHNKAIAFYLPRGVHFVVVTSIEDGNLTQSMIRRLDDVKTYGGGFTFVLSKCNLRSAAQVEQVRGYIDEQLHAYFDGENKTLPAGRDDTGKFATCLEQIDVNMLFDSLFIGTLKTQSHDLIRQINLAISTVKKDGGQSERELRVMEQALAGLQTRQEDTQNELRQRYSSRMLHRCLRGIEEDLNNALEELTTLAGTPNSTRLNTVLAEVVRSSLTRNIQREIEDISTSMIDDLAARLAGSGLGDAGLDEGWIAGLTSRVKETLEKTNQMLTNWSERHKKGEEDKEKIGRLYKGISVILAVTTQVVAPVLELAIIYLPEILRLINGNNQRQMVRERLQKEIFPGIKAELRNNLPAILNEQLTIVLAKVNQGFEEQISQQQSIIIAYRRQSDASKAETDARLATLEQLANDVKSLATRYLYA